MAAVMRENTNDVNKRLLRVFSHPYAEFFFTPPSHFWGDEGDTADSRGSAMHKVLNGSGEKRPPCSASLLRAVEWQRRTSGSALLCEAVVKCQGPHPDFRQPKLKCKMAGP